MYKLHANLETKQITGVIRLADRTWIPFALDNKDYQAYLKWLEEGNTPEPADEQQ